MTRYWDESQQHRLPHIAKRGEAGKQATVPYGDLFLVYIVVSSTIRMNLDAPMYLHVRHSKPLYGQYPGIQYPGFENHIALEAEKLFGHP